jgi:chromosome segregation ATPase
MSKCEDCGMQDPPDDHECAQYEERMKAEKELQTLEQILDQIDNRLTELERRVATLSIQARESTPWRKI